MDSDSDDFFSLSEKVVKKKVPKKSGEIVKRKSKEDDTTEKKQKVEKDRKYNSAEPLVEEGFFSGYFRIEEVDFYVFFYKGVIYIEWVPFYKSFSTKENVVYIEEGTSTPITKNVKHKKICEILYLVLRDIKDKDKQYYFHTNRFGGKYASKRRAFSYSVFMTLMDRFIICGYLKDESIQFIKDTVSYLKENYDYLESIAVSSNKKNFDVLSNIDMDINAKPVRETLFRIANSFKLLNVVAKKITCDFVTEMSKNWLKPK